MSFKAGNASAPATFKFPFNKRLFGQTVSPGMMLLATGQKHFGVTERAVAEAMTSAGAMSLGPTQARLNSGVQRG